MVTGKKWLQTALILIVIGLGGVELLDAARPMRPESVLANSGGMDALLHDPVTNMASISVVLKGPSPATTAARNAILGTKTNGQDLAGQAALSYLAGEALYWSTFDRLRSGAIKTNQVSQMPRADIILKYLDAWNCACQMGTNGGTRMRQVVANRLKTLLATSTFGAALPEDVKIQVVHRFVDEIEKQKESPVRWTPDQKAGIYANMGIAQRLPQQIPLELPEDREALQAALALAMAMHQPTQAVRFASALEVRYAEHLRRDSNLWYQVYRAYQCSRSPRALPCLRAVAAQNHCHYLELYDLVMSTRTNKPDKEMLEYLAAYLQSTRGEEPRQVAAVRSVAHRMFAAGFFDEALCLMDRYYPNDAYFDITLTKIRGQCFEKQGRTNEAISAYTQHEWYKSAEDRESRDAQFCLERIHSLGVKVSVEIKDK